MKKLYIALLCSLFFSARAQVFNITSYGAVGDSVTMNTTSIQAAIDSCHNHGGGIVEVPAGIFLTATLYLKSNVIIRLDQGATIKGSPNTTDYPDIVPSIRSYADNYPQRSVFYAEGQSNIGIIGQGTFNGNGLSTDFILNAGHKPFGFRFISCTNVIYDGVTLINSGFWMMHNFNIDTLTIKNLTIVNQAWGNNDGIDIDGCRHVLVDSCTADCNDDAIVIKTTAPIGNDSIEVRNCTVGTYSRAIKIGTETFGPTSNVYIHDINVIFSPHGVNYPGLCGINLAAVNGGSLQNILVENITMTGINTAICIRQGLSTEQYTGTVPAPSSPGFVHDVQLKNITATVSTNITSTVTGIPGYDLSGISLQDVNVTFPGGWAARDSNFVVPENIGAAPQATIFGDTLPAAGMYSRHVDSLQLINVCFTALQPDGRPDFWLDDVGHIDTSGLCGTMTRKNIPTGLIVENMDESIKVFPNPAEDIVYINLPGNMNAKVSLSDINGKRILETVISNSAPHSIDVSSLSSGVYIVTVQSTEGITSGRIVKH